MSLTLQMEQARWRATVQRILAGLKLEKVAFLRQQFRLLLERIIAPVPPRNRAQGRARVAADIRKVMQPFARLRNERMKKLVRRGDLAALNAIAAQLGKPWRFTNTVSNLRSLHEERRDRRGRVTGSARKALRLVGAANIAAYRRYVRTRQDSVGVAKAGWLPGAKAVGAHVPSWVAAQGLAFGAVIDRSQHAVSPELIAINRTPWAHRRDEGQRILANALASRRRDMERHAAALARAAAKRAGLPA